MLSDLFNVLDKERFFLSIQPAITLLFLALYSSYVVAIDHFVPASYLLLFSVTDITRDYYLMIFLPLFSAAPSVSNVCIVGDAVEGNTIKGTGEYFGGKEGPSKYEWLREKENG